MNIIVALLFVFVIFCFVVFLFGFFLSGPTYKGPKSDHFDGKKFINPNGLEAKGFKDVFKFIRERKMEPYKFNYETFVRTDSLPEKLEESKIKITFVNHSTFLIQYAGLNILTDPIWSFRCSPFQFAGPHRMRPPGVKFEDLPNIDLVLLSHNHYDHFDTNTVKDLIKKCQPQFVVPLGMKNAIEKLGGNKVEEIDWHQSIEFEKLNITGTPANHFTSRGFFDRDKTLWCGYLLQFGKHKLYFVGDTGYGPNFKEIGNTHGPIDISLIPIGAYKPEWFMGPIHISPPQAIQVHKDIQSIQSIAMHFGTFPLADDGQDTAQNELILAMKNEKMDPSKFLIPDEGFSYDFE